MESDLLELYESGVEMIREERYREAVADLKRFIESNPPDFGRREHARMLAGYACGRMDDWESAAKHFKDAMLNDIECLPAHTALGHAYLMTGRVGEAVEIFRLAVQKDAKNPQARHGLGWALLLEEKDLDEALYQTQEALRLDPKSAAIRDSLGWAFYKHGDLEAAEEQMEEAVSLDPDHPVILAHRREIRQKLKEKRTSL